MSTTPVNNDKSYEDYAYYIAPVSDDDDEDETEAVKNPKRLAADVTAAALQGIDEAQDAAEEDSKKVSSGQSDKPTSELRGLRNVGNRI